MLMEKFLLHGRDPGTLVANSSRFALGSSVKGQAACWLSHGLALKRHPARQKILVKPGCEQVQSFAKGRSEIHHKGTPSSKPLTDKRRHSDPKLNPSWAEVILLAQMIMLDNVSWLSCRGRLWVVRLGHHHA